MLNDWFFVLHAKIIQKNGRKPDFAGFIGDYSDAGWRYFWNCFDDGHR